jgi:low affinity Fe/Cu permease
MADIVLNIVTNVDDAANDLNKVKDSMKDVKQEASTSGAAFKSWTSQVESVEDAMSRVAREAKNAGKVSMDVSRNVASGMNTAEKSVTSLRQQARIMTQQLAQMEISGKANTDEYKRMSMALGNVRDAMGDAANKAKFWQDDIRWVTASTQAVQGLVGAYSLYAGIMGLVDEEDKDLQKTMQKMQSLMVIMMGLTEVSTMLQKDSMVMQAKRTVVDKLHEFQLRVNARAEATNAIAVNTSTIATKANAAGWRVLNAVMKANVFIAVATAVLGIAFALKQAYDRQQEYIKSMGDFEDALNGNIQSARDLEEHYKQVATSAEDAEFRLRVATGKMKQDEYDKAVKTKEFDAVKKESSDLTRKLIKDEENARNAARGQVIKHYDELIFMMQQDGINTESLEAEKMEKLADIDNKSFVKMLDIWKKYGIDIRKINKTLANELKIIEAESQKQRAEKIRTQYQILTDKINALVEKMREQITVRKQLDPMDERELKYLQDKKKAIDDITTGLGTIIRIAPKAQISSISIADNALPKTLTKIVSDEAKKAGEDAGGSFWSGFVGFITSQDEETREIRDAISGFLDSSLDTISELLQNSFDSNIDALEGYISNLDTAISEAQSKLDEQLRLQEEGSASNVAIEKKRLEELTAQREKYIAEREKQVQKERKLEQTMATIKAAIAATEAIASAVSQGGWVGAITGALAAAAIIADIALMYSTAEGAIKFAHGNAEILGGNSHAGGGVSLGQYGEAEGGEFLGILSKNKTAKYGKSMLTLFDGINNSNDRKIAAGLMSLTGNIPIGGGSNEVELKEVKAINGMYNIMKQPAKTVIIEGNKRIERNGRNTRIIYN